MSTKDLSLTKSNFGRKGWGILVLAFFSILLMSSIIYDSLNVTIEIFAQKFGMNNPAPLYLFSTVGPKRAVLITLILGLFSLILNLVGGYLKVGGNAGAAKALMFAAQPFLGVMLGGAANYLVSLTTTIWGRYDFNMAYRVLKPLIAIIGALGISIVGGLGNTVGYSYAYLVLAILAVIAIVFILIVDDSYVGYTESKNKSEVTMEV